MHDFEVHLVLWFGPCEVLFHLIILSAHLSGWLFQWLGLYILSFICWLVLLCLLFWMRSSSSWTVSGVTLDLLSFIFPLHNDYFLLSIILIFMLCYLIRSSGYCSFCFLLLLPSACGDCWGNDAWSEISFRYDSPHEVMDFCRIGILFLFYLFVAVGWHFSDHSLIELICSQMGSHSYELFSL